MHLTYVDQGAGRLGDRIPVRAGFSSPVQIGPGAHPASYTMGEDKGHPTTGHGGPEGGRGAVLLFL
jgi:hypothetical protein